MTSLSRQKRGTGFWIGVGLSLGILCGLTFGDYCGLLQGFGDAYVGLLQMTVLPYLVLALIAKMGRLDLQQAARLGRTAVAVLLLFWLIAVVLVVLASTMLPPIEGASFFNRSVDQPGADEPDFVTTLIPINVFRALSEELVPAVVVFCLLFGAALTVAPGKERLLDFLDLCCEVVGRINEFLIRLAPIGLFLLTAAAAGTLHVDQLSRLQGYLAIFILSSLVAAFGILPLLVTSFTSIGYRQLIRAAHEPLLMAIATGKLFVVLPQIVEKCEGLLAPDKETAGGASPSTASVVAPLAYSFPHIGKILSFVFISFAAWYLGRSLTPSQTAVMAASGAISSFASPLVTMPFFLDRYQLSHDLMALFILPGFVTMRVGDMVGVMHLMALTLIVDQSLRGRVRLRPRRLLAGGLTLLACLGLVGAGGRWYLASTTLEYDLDKRFLALEIPSPHADVVVYRSRDEAPSQTAAGASTLDRVKAGSRLRVGYPPDQLPYSFFNSQDRLVGMDVELMHRLAARLEVTLEFVPIRYDTVIAQLQTGEIDLAIGGLMMPPERLLRAGFTQPYQEATMAVVLPDYRRGEFDAWDDPQMPAQTRLGVAQKDLIAPARRQLPNVEIDAIDSIRSFFEGRTDGLDGLILPAEAGAAWNVLYPEHAVVVPRPVVRRPIGMAVRLGDDEWVRFLDRWIDFERMDGSLDRLRTYWIEGGAAQQRGPRWCIIRDVLHWVR